MPRTNRAARQLEHSVDYRDEEIEGSLDHRATDQAIAACHRNATDFTRRGLDFIASAGIPDGQEIAAMSISERRAMHHRVLEQTWETLNDSAHVATFGDNEVTLVEYAATAEIVAFAMEQSTDEVRTCWLTAYGEAALAGESPETMDFIYETATGKNPVDWDEIRELEFNNQVTAFAIADAIAAESVQDAANAAHGSRNPKAAIATADAAMNAIRLRCVNMAGQADFSRQSEVDVGNYSRFLTQGIGENAGFLTGYEPLATHTTWYGPEQMVDFAYELEARLNDYRQNKEEEFQQRHPGETDTPAAIRFTNETMHMDTLQSLVNDLKQSAFLFNANTDMMEDAKEELNDAGPGNPTAADLQTEFATRSESALTHRDNALAAIEFISYASAPRREQPSR